MADIINLRQARKAHARSAARATAETNRAKFGRTREQRTADAQETRRRERDLDGAKRDGDAKHPE